jgi:hypothetical protein
MASLLSLMDPLLTCSPSVDRPAGLLQGVSGPSDSNRTLFSANG